MKRRLDTITIEHRLELHDLLLDLKKIPKSERSEATEDLIKLLTSLDYEW